MYLGLGRVGPQPAARLPAVLPTELLEQTGPWNVLCVLAVCMLEGGSPALCRLGQPA